MFQEWPPIIFYIPRFHSDKLNTERGKRVFNPSSDLCIVNNSLKTHHVDRNTRKLIVAEATESFAKYGIKGTTMQLLAESLHISKRTLYECFPDKTTLLTECVRQAVALNLRVIRTRTAHTDGLNALLHTLDSVYRLLTAPYPSFRLEIIRQRNVRTMLNERYRTSLQEIVEQQVLQARTEGLFLPDTSAQGLFQLFEGLLTAAAGEPSDAWSHREFFDATVWLCLSGLCTEQGRERLKDLNAKNLTVEKRCARLP